MANDNGSGLALRRDAAMAPDVSAAKAFEPGSFAEGMQVARALVESRLFPTIKTPEAAFAIIATGRELGLSMMQSLRGLHVIEGKPTLSADAMAGLVKSRRDVCAYFRMVESSDRIATYETLRAGEPSPTRMSFSWEDAQRAGATGKDNWKKYPAAMLRARCITALARAVYPDLLMGVYEPEELSRGAVQGNYEVVTELPTTTPEPPKSEPRLSAEEVDKAVQVYVQVIDAATSVDDLVRVFSEARKDDRLLEGNVSYLKGLCGAKRAALEAKGAA
jgi:hypothetical protein